MANFAIDSINYIVTGKTEKIININLSNQIEYDNANNNYGGSYLSNVTFFTDEGPDLVSDAKLFLSDEYKTHRMKRIDEDSGITTSDLSNCIYDLFDAKDIDIKSTTAKRKIDDKKTVMSQIFNSNDYLDVYAPKMNSNPIEFCQMGESFAFGMTELTYDGPVIKYTSLNESRYERLSSDSSSLEWNFELRSKANPAYVYIPLSNLFVCKGNRAELSDYYPAQSLYDYITSFGDLSNNMISDLYICKYNMLNVGRNYILNIPTTNLKFNDHNNADIQGDFYYGKNTYDSEYSENMTEVEKLKNARNYCGIGATGGKVFLKYYDEDAYESIKKNLTTSISKEVQDLSTNHTTFTDETRSYQNVEMIESINKFSNAAKHKSNLYSIVIKNTGIDNTNEQIAPYVDKIKQDIVKSVKVIAKNLQPAHTQLFNVTFKDQA